MRLGVPRERSRCVEYLSVSCGGCIGCRTARAREWAIRCGLELSGHRDASWATLTYDDTHLPPTLFKEHVSGWIKRIRARLSPHRVRFFASGEYGERTARPHYHAIVFGLPKGDRSVQAAWPYGYARSDSLSPEAIAYVAGYCSKKIGWKVEARDQVDPDTGEVYRFQPPFVLMSRNPGIAGDARKFWRSWRDSAVHGGRLVPVPRYLHASWLEHATVADVDALLLEQKAKARECDRSDARLEAGEAIAVARRDLQSARRIAV